MFSFLPVMIAGFIGAYFYNHAEEKNMSIKSVFLMYFSMVMLINAFFYLTAENKQAFWFFSLVSSMVAATFCSMVVCVLRKCKGIVEQNKRNKQAELPHDRTNEK